eukprot:PhM_4_TR2436/c1_g2_i1/m.78642
MFFFSDEAPTFFTLCNTHARVAVRHAEHNPLVRRRRRARTPGDAVEVVQVLGAGPDTDGELHRRDLVAVHHRDPTPGAPGLGVEHGPVDDVTHVQTPRRVRHRADAGEGAHVGHVVGVDVQTVHSAGDLRDVETTGDGVKSNVRRLGQASRRDGHLARVQVHLQHAAAGSVGHVDVLCGDSHADTAAPQMHGVHQLHRLGAFPVPRREVDGIVCPLDEDDPAGVAGVRGYGDDVVAGDLRDELLLQVGGPDLVALGDAHVAPGGVRADAQRVAQFERTQCPAPRYASTAEHTCEARSRLRRVVAAHIGRLATAVL